MSNFRSQHEFLKEKGVFLKKNAYFTLKDGGLINRKVFHNIIPAAVYVDDIKKFIDYSMNYYSEAEDREIRKISRRTTDNICKIKKNILKLIANGKHNHALSYCKELYFRDEKEFFKILFDYILMDNIDFNKAIQVYSMREYFKKFGYNDIIMDLVLGFVSKMRSDFHDFEYSKDSLISKEKLKDKIYRSKKKLMTKEGFKIVSYFKILEAFEYKKEKKYVAILESRIKDLEKKQIEPIGEIEKEILIKLFV